MMEIKRNIFESRGKMPPRNETVSAAMLDKDDVGYMPPHAFGKPDHSVRHAPIPRIGEQK